MSTFSLRPSGQRTAWTPYLFLVLTDLAAVATLARCFSGPGELAVAIPTCLLAHLVFGAGRRLTSRAKHKLALAGLFLLLGALGVLLLPLALVVGGSFSSGLPLGATWHLVHGELGRALTIFSSKIAPVVEAPGLVLVTAWAAGTVGLAAEVLYADSGLPALLALVPAFDVVVFSGTLGTSSGRAVEIALIAGLALSFLVLAQSDRQRERRVLMARTEAGASNPAGAGRRLFFPGMAAVAAVAAGVAGPLIPGAGSAPLVAWHGRMAHGPGGTSTGGGGSNQPSRVTPNKIAVSDLVQVAQQEIDNSDALLFTVESRVRTREVLVTLDRFDGVSWSSPRRSTGLSIPIGRGSLGSPHELASRPPPATSQPDGSRRLAEVIDIAALGGRDLPVPGRVFAVSGIPGPVSESSRSGPVRSPDSLYAGLKYAVRADLPPARASVLESETPLGRLQPGSTPSGELQLPKPLPARLVSLAHRIVARTSTEFAAATALENYFLSGHGFTYRLPKVTPQGAIANTSASYRALEAFLFSTRTGYCQQYATAFAVLARIDKVPTRIALGFLPGREIGRHRYEVTGVQVHAWPQVWFPHYGWVNFEPTPGTTGPSGAGGGKATNPTTTLAGAGSHATTPPAHNLRKLSGSGKASQIKPVLPANRVGQSGFAYLLYAIAGLAVLWALVVPGLRLVFWRRLRRDPARATAAAWAAASSVLSAASAHRRRSETNLEFAERVRRLGLLSDSASEALFSLAVRLDASLYGPPGALPQRGELRAAWSESDEIRRSARRRIPRLQLLLGLFDPRDLRGV